MHPSPAYAWSDRQALQAFVADAAFAQVTLIADGRPLAVHAPLAFLLDGRPAFHLARGNPAIRHLDGTRVLATVVGAHGYVSPDWYGTADQVPTWNYRLVEIEGRAVRLDDALTEAQVVALGTGQEARLAPKPAWTVAKLAADRYARLLGAIAGFAIEDAAFSGTAKLGQDKRLAEREGVVAALRGIGATALADDMDRA